MSQFFWRFHDLAEGATIETECIHIADFRAEIDADAPSWARRMRPTHIACM